MRLRESDGGGVAVVLARDLEPRDELCISYSCAGADRAGGGGGAGDGSQLESFLNFGFWDDDDPLVYQ